MNSEKATGPDGIAFELWKAESWSPIGLFRKVKHHLIDNKVPQFQYGKRKVVQQDVQIIVRSDYFPIEFERILDNRITGIVKITVNQAGVVKKCETTDAIHTALLLVKKHREKDRPNYNVFLYLDKVFDRVPHELIWYALRQPLVKKKPRSAK